MLPEAWTSWLVPMDMEEVVMVVPADVVVRRAEPSDAAALQALMAMPIAQSMTMQVPFPSVGEWQARLDDPPDEFRLLLACEGGVDGQVVGSLGIGVGTRPRRRHVASIGMAVHDDWTGRGIGTRLVAAALDLADNWLQVTRVELEVFTDNGPALALYSRFGFEVEGTQRMSVFRGGEYVDTHVMARLHPGLRSSWEPVAGPTR